MDFNSQTDREDISLSHFVLSLVPSNPLPDHHSSTGPVGRAHHLQAEDEGDLEEGGEGQPVDCPVIKLVL